MGSEFAAMFRIRWRSLVWSADLLKELKHSSDAEAVAVAANWGLDAIYDLFELYRIRTNAPRAISRQDDIFGQTRGETLGGLMFMRGEKTHAGKRVESLNPLRVLPYDFVKLTDWTWSRLEITPTDKFAQRAEWYKHHVENRPLWIPLETAQYWFLSNWPDKTPPPEIVGTSVWVEGVRPVFSCENT